MKRWRNALFALMALALLMAGLGVATQRLWSRKATTPLNQDRGRPTSKASTQPIGAVEKDRPIELSLSIREKIGLQEATVDFRAIEEVMAVNGVIRSHPDLTVAISPRIEGKVLGAWGLPGDPVEKGQRLVEMQSLELENLQTDLIQAWNRLELANTNRDLARELSARKAIAFKELLRKEMEQRQAVREVEGLEARLRLIGIGDTQIEQMKTASRASPLLILRAPMAGVIVERHVVLGEPVKPEQVLFRLADLRRVFAEGEAFESQAVPLRRGLLVRLTVAAFPGRTFEGRVTSIGAAVDPEKRTIRFLAEIENLSDAHLRPNMFAQMTVVIREQAKALVIPLDAVIVNGGQEVVFVAAPDGYERRQVSLGHRDDRFVEVRRGLAQGERVVTTGKRQLEVLYRRGIEGRGGGPPREGAETDAD